MRIGVHPTVVAVALGLLGPNALAESEPESDTACAGPAPAVPCGEACTCFGAEPARDAGRDADAVTTAFASMVRD